MYAHFAYIVAIFSKNMPNGKRWHKKAKIPKDFFGFATDVIVYFIQKHLFKAYLNELGIVWSLILLQLAR